MRSVLVLLALTDAAWAQSSDCPIPDVALHVAAEGTAFDAPTTGAILATLAVAVERDAARAASDRLSLGAELSGLQQGASDVRMVSAAAGSLATRLRQLDCAVWRGRAPDAARLYRDIAAAVVALQGPHASAPPLPPRWWPLPPPSLRLDATPDPVRQARRVRNYTLGGVGALAAGLGFIGGAIDLTINVVNYRPPPPCEPHAFLCLNGLSAGLHAAEVATMSLLWGVGAATTLTGVVLLVLGQRARLARVQPQAQLTPGGGVVGVRVRF